MTYEQEDIDRFWRGVRKTDGCWEWSGGCYTSGYGYIKIKYRSMRTHRVSYEIANGEIKDGRMVCHKCDNRKCVRPGHLFLGTQEDNMSDMVRKGRSPHGENNPDARLTATQAHEMRYGFLVGLTTHKLARIFDVGLTTAKQVCNGSTWVSRVR